MRKVRDANTGEAVGVSPGNQVYAGELGSGGSITAFSETSVTLYRGVYIKNPSGNDKLWIGDSEVSGNNGYPILGGGTLFVAIDDLSSIYYLRAEPSDPVAYYVAS